MEQRDWVKRREDTLIVCDNEMPLKPVMKIYTKIIQPLLLHGMEVIPMKEAHERLSEAAVIKWIIRY